MLPSQKTQVIASFQKTKAKQSHKRYLHTVFNTNLCCSTSPAIASWLDKTNH